MNTPSAAFAWELWRRHRPRVAGIAVVLLAFILVYPKLCALAGFNPASPDPLAEMAQTTALRLGEGFTLYRLAQVLYFLGVLICGPAALKALSLLCVIWMFTFAEFDHKIKDPLKFPARLFTLPVSTAYLFWWLLLGGLAAVAALYAAWAWLTPQPRLEIFGMRQNCLGWMTLLVLAQAIVWAMAAWPGTRMLVLIGVVFAFLGVPDSYNFFAWPIVLPLAAVLARAGLQKMRCGQWQGWAWKWPFATPAARAEMTGPRRFASPAQAQLWFDWRRFSRGVCFITVAMILTPMVVFLSARAAGLVGPLSQDGVGGVCTWLVAVPVFIHFAHGASPPRSDQAFLMARPLTSGEMFMPMLKTAAISTAISWVAVLAAFGALSLLGDFSAVAREVSALPGGRAAFVLGFVFLTWRMAVVNLCFALSGSRRLASVPPLLVVAIIPALGVIFSLEQNGAHWHLFLRQLPFLLTGLVAVKFLLAAASFGLALKRRLLSADALLGYLAVWVVLVAALLVVMVLTHPPRQAIFPLSLGAVLLVPLARIGFCPLALARFRSA